MEILFKITMVAVQHPVSTDLMSLFLTLIMFSRGLTMLTFTCSDSAIEDVVLMYLLLTLNMFHTFF